MKLNDLMTNHVSLIHYIPEILKNKEYFFIFLPLVYYIQLTWNNVGGGGVKGTKPCTLKNQHKTSDPPQP